jgi:hypothetical protein
MVSDFGNKAVFCRTNIEYYTKYKYSETLLVLDLPKPVPAGLHVVPTFRHISLRRSDAYIITIGPEPL